MNKAINHCSELAGKHWHCKQWHVWYLKSQYLKVWYSKCTYILCVIVKMNKNHFSDRCDTDKTKTLRCVYYHKWTNYRCGVRKSHKIVCIFWLFLFEACDTDKIEPSGCVYSTYSPIYLRNLLSLAQGNDPKSSFSSKRLGQWNAAHRSVMARLEAAWKGWIGENPLIPASLNGWAEMGL